MNYSIAAAVLSIYILTIPNEHDYRIFSLPKKKSIQFYKDGFVTMPLL